MAQTKAGAIKIAAKKVGVALEEYQAKIAAGLKHCRECRLWLTVASFVTDRSRYDGLASRCKLCSRGGPKQLRLIRPTPSEIQRHRYATDEAYRHRTKHRVYARRRATQPISYEDAIVQMAAAEGCCVYCGRAAESWDHIVPVSKGGSSRRHNLAPCCLRCNCRKKDLELHDFVKKYNIPLTDRLISFIENATTIGDYVP